MKQENKEIKKNEEMINELVEQAERKVIPSTLRPDLVNASVGSMLYEMHSGNCVRRFPDFC